MNCIDLFAKIIDMVSLSGVLSPGPGGQGSQPKKVIMVTFDSPARAQKPNLAVLHDPLDMPEHGVGVTLDWGDRPAPRNSNTSKEQPSENPMSAAAADHAEQASPAAAPGQSLRWD